MTWVRKGVYTAYTLWGVGTYAAALRSLRLLLIFPLLLNTTVSVRKVLARNYLGSVLLVALAFTLMSELLMAGIDPSIENVCESELSAGKRGSPGELQTLINRTTKIESDIFIYDAKLP